MKLYSIRGSRSHRIRWALEELGLDYEIEPMTFMRDSIKSETYLEKNPSGLVPTLEDGDVLVFESGAILEYLAEHYDPNALLLPTAEPERSMARSWMHWSEATLSPALSDYIGHTSVRPEDKRIPAVAEDAKKRLNRNFRAIGRQLAKHEFLAGHAFSGADIMLGLTLHLCSITGLLGEDHGVVRDYYERMAARPAFGRADAD
ncbi:MAG: glutathione S-transferase family protein [Myxococcota bacterium]|nr:glutathione S-transferase family protein [Myxococcota bacterium]